MPSPLSLFKLPNIVMVSSKAKLLWPPSLPSKTLRESIRKLSNFNFQWTKFNFQWTKTLYQNNLKHTCIAFFLHFSRAKDIMVICNNTKENKMASYTWNFLEFYLCFHYSFSQTPVINLLWCYYRWLITSLALEKCKKECTFSLHYSGTRFLSTDNFLVDSVLIQFFSSSSFFVVLFLHYYIIQCE